MIPFKDALERVRAETIKERESEQSGKSEHLSWEDALGKARRQAAGNGERVKDWFAGVIKTAQDIDEYYSSDTYKAPNSAFNTAIQGYLDSSEKILSDIQVNQNQYADYEGVLKQYNETVDYLKNIKDSVFKTNEWYASFAPSEDEAAVGYTAEQLYNQWRERYGITIDELRQNLEKAKATAARLRQQEKEAKANYDNYYDTSRDDVETYDFLREGPEKRALYEQYERIRAEAEKADKEAARLAQMVATRVASTETDKYYSVDLADLEKMIQDQKGAVDAARVVSREAQKAYSEFLNPSDGSIPEAFTRTEEEKAEQQSKHDTILTDVTKVQEEQIRLNEMEDIYTYRRDMQTIGNMTELERLALETRAAGGSNSKKHLAWKTAMDDKAIDPYRYLEEKGYSSEEIKSLTETYSRYLNEQNARTVQLKSESFAQRMPILSTITTYPAQLIGSVTGAIDAVGGIAKNALGLSQYKTLDPNTAGYMPQAYAQAVRGEVSSDMSGAGKAVYEAVNSTADNLLRVAVGGRIGSMVLAATSAFGSTVRDVTLKGGTPAEAFLMGIADAGIEALTEIVSVDTLLKISTARNGAELLKNMLRQGFVEMTEEEASFVGSLLAETAIRGKDSDFNRRVGELEYLVDSTEEAKKVAYKELFQEAAEIGITSFLSGSFMEGVHGGVSSIVQNIASHTQQPQSALQSGVDPQVESGQTTQETAAEPAPGSLEWVQELNELGAGKVAQKNAVQANSNKYHLRDYSQQQKDNWRNSKRIVLYEGVEQFKNFIKNALSGKTQTNKKLYFGAVDSDLATAISTETGVNVEGYNLALGENEIRKINKDHGSEQTEAPRGQRAVTEADYLNIPNVVQSPDSIKLSSKLYEGKPVIEFRKTNGNETTVVSAVVSDKRLDLFVQTTYVNKKKGSVATPESEQADSNTPKATGGTAPADASLGDVQPVVSNSSHGTSSDASNNNIPQTPPVVNTDSAQPTSPVSVGAAPAGFDPNSHLQYQYGTLPEGENAVRPDDLPVSTDGKNRVSQTAVTVKGAQVTSDEFSDLLTKDVTEKNGMTYIPITNDATVQKAIDHIKAEGWVNAKAKWHADVQNGKAGADMAAVGALLLNNAAKAGDKTAWLDILHDYQILGTNTAQGLQALRILKKLSPSDKLYMAKRSVKQMVEEMKLDTDVTIDPELETEYNEAETDAQRDEVLVKIQKDVARQLPTTLMEKFTALRYVNMLGNLRTQGRNIVGNLTMMGTRAIHNAIATGIETVANKVSGGKIQRTRSVTVSKEQKAAAAKDFDGLQEQILGGGKYNDNMTATGFARGVQEQKKIFKFKPLEGYRKVTNWAMEQGDIIFARDAYARALAGYLKANGITETDFSKVDPGVMDDARLFAAKEAQEATFRDTNWLSGWVSKVGRRKDTPAGVKILSEGVMPFRKTPANVLVRAEEYSPLAIVNSAVMSVQKLAGNTSLVNKHGLLGKFARAGQEITGTQVINSWAKTLTGTGLFGIGMLLQGLGLLSAGPDEDDKEDAFEDLNGWQDYALTLPDGTNLTIDCFSPSAIPVLMGAQLMKLIRENGLQLKDFETALTSIADPLVEMSMLQGVNDSLENIQYADSNVGQLVINAGLSYLTQGLTNTLAGQLERSFEDSRMQTYVDKDSDLPSWLQRTLGKASAKTPGWDYNQIPYINAWGEEEENPDLALNLVYNLLSPSYFDKGKDDEVTRELTRLNDAQSDVNVYPSVPDKTVTINKQDYNLSADEYVSLAKLQGQTQKQLVEDLIGNSAYGVLSDEDKAQAIRCAYDYAQQSARGDVIKGHPGITTEWMKELKGDIAEGILRHITADGKYTALSVSDAAYIDDLLDGLTAEKGRSNVRPIQQIEAIADSKLSEADQKKVLEETLNESAYDKFMAVLKLGMDTDDYAASYRLYLDAESGSGKKARIIKSFQNELDVTYSVAVKLYNIYAGKK